MTAGINYALRSETNNASIYSQSMELKAAMPAWIAEFEKPGCDSFALCLWGTRQGQVLRISVLSRQCVKEQAIPFRIGEPVFNDETRKTIEDAGNGIGLNRGFTSVSELTEEL